MPLNKKDTESKVASGRPQGTYAQGYNFQQDHQDRVACEKVILNEVLKEVRGMRRMYKKKKMVQNVGFSCSVSTRKKKWFILT